MKKTKKRFLGIIMSLVMVMVTMISVPVYAAGTQTLYKTSSSGDVVGSFHCYNNNTTPVKTIGESGNFYIFGTSIKGDTLSGNVKVKIQIRDAYTGSVLTSTESYAVSTDGTVHVFDTTPMYLEAGRKIRIFFDVCSVGTPPGGYRSADISYSYVLQ